jgi:hypothetical protein
MVTLEALLVDGSAATTTTTAAATAAEALIDALAPLVKLAGLRRLDLQGNGALLGQTWTRRRGGATGSTLPGEELSVVTDGSTT